eukprot:COSAG03_NODE_2229_length_2977_cov_36.285268_3_plen_179_part_00
MREFEPREVDAGLIATHCGYREAVAQAEQYLQKLSAPDSTDSSDGSDSDQSDGDGQGVSVHAGRAALQNSAARLAGVQGRRSASHTHAQQHPVAADIRVIPGGWQPPAAEGTRPFSSDGAAGGTDGNAQPQCDRFSAERMEATDADLAEPQIAAVAAAVAGNRSLISLDLSGAGPFPP